MRGVGIDGSQGACRYALRQSPCGTQTNVWSKTTHPLAPIRYAARRKLNFSAAKPGSLRVAFETTAG